MNAKSILEQVMKQASSSQKGAGGLDVQSMVNRVSSVLGSGGGAPDAGSGSQGAVGKAQGSGVDMKSLLGGGALGLLVGSKRGRKMGGKALKYGAIAGVGALAWKAWQNARGDSAGSEAKEGRPMERLEGVSQEQRSLELLQAVIMAARADGHIDDRERALLTEQIDAMGADAELHDWVEQQLSAPLDAEALARQADSPQAAREMYLISVAVIDEQNPMERAWLDQLGGALGLDDGMRQELERQALSAS
ncbi:tellurite resistance TerB family protein [Halomonas urmiana]|uniref:Tellurite resistance TerB family protein n=1 Tax=Halomonas urmiana TaxID=490901 RepID=A0A5R8MKF1_9GAMM|nr:tellurite resistance TerB family protein [Halomonas urmiana]TLF52593.1 tellurite resistance TerB family protein [Halomonas urmiana]